MPPKAPSFRATWASVLFYEPRSTGIHLIATSIALWIPCFPDKELKAHWILMRVPAGPPWQWWFCDTVWGHHFIEKHKKLLLETSQHSNSSTCVGGFYNLPVPFVSIRVLPKYLWHNSATGVIFTTYLTGFLFGNLQRQQWVGLRHPSSYTRHSSCSAETW